MIYYFHKRFFVKVRSNHLLFIILYTFQSQEDLWLSSAQKLTNIIKQIIEFAKMVPGFMKFAQDDQIALLKRGKNIKTWSIIKLGRGI